MRRLIWGFAGRTYHIVGNLMHWLKCNMKLHFFRKSDYSIQFTKIFHWVILVNNKGFRFGITECNHPYKVPLKASNDILMFQIFTKAKDIFLSEWAMLVWSDGWPITWSSAPQNVHYWVPLCCVILQAFLSSAAKDIDRRQKSTLSEESWRPL